MYSHPGVKTDPAFPVPESMAGVGPRRSRPAQPRPEACPGPPEGRGAVRIDAIAICATDLDVISSGPPAMIQGGLPFNKNFTPGHEYMGTVAALGPASTSSPSATG